MLISYVKLDHNMLTTVILILCNTEKLRIIMIILYNLEMWLLLTAVNNNSRLTFPESTTNRTPSMVTEVSAILVEMMHFLTPSGATSNTLSCSSIERAL